MQGCSIIAQSVSGYMGEVETVPDAAFTFLSSHRTSLLSTPSPLPFLPYDFPSRSAPEQVPDITFSAGYEELTFLAPTDFAFAKAAFRPRVSAADRQQLVEYHILTGLYSFAQLKALPNRSQIPTAAGKSIMKHSVRASWYWNPGTSVALSSPGAQQLFWAQIDTKKLFNGNPGAQQLFWAQVATKKLLNGQYVKGHVIDCVLVPN
ncbi:unnamed protein product [Closterium sp. Naga37s-1]|nr:unnamed protein product [Closterium sp. Naga37s-1]